MSDDESSGSEAEEVAPKPQAKKPSAMPKTAGLDEASVELLESNRKDRDKMEEEIQDLRARAVKRKKQRDIEEKRMAAERAAEEERRKAVEEEKKRKREEEEQKSIAERANKQAEFEKMRSQTGPNFVINKKKEGHSEEKDPDVKDKKSREQLEAEKKAILSQRVQALEISGFDGSKLKEKAKDLLKVIYKLEGEKYDLEKRFKIQQADMMELAEKARQANKVGKGGLKRVQAGEEVDVIQTRFAGTPAKIEMYSKYERQTDKREYSEKKGRFAGPQFISPVDKIKPTKAIKWDDDRIPLYCEGAHPAEQQEQGQPPAE